MKPPKLLALDQKVRPIEHLIEDQVCMLGRHPRCQVVVDQQSISRLHAKIEYDAPYYVLSDTKSANGTFVNGQRIYQPHLLTDYDEIGLASPAPLLRFEDSDPTLSVSSRLSYNKQAMTFSLNKEPLALPPAQFRLLYHLYQHAGNVCSRESCAQAIWDRAYDPDVDAEAFDRAISKLRCRLREIDPQTDMLETRRGLGYVLHP